MAWRERGTAVALLAVVVTRLLTGSPLARAALRSAGAAYGALVLVAVLAVLVTGDEGRVGIGLAALLIPIAIALASTAVRSGISAARMVHDRRLRANVGRALAALAPGYRLLPRLAVSEGRESHVAIGPNGVFVILARTDGGRVTASTRRLFVNARLPWRDLVDDCRVDALRVRERVRRTLGREVPVHAVLCFARALVAVGQEIQGVKVVHAGRVARLIGSTAAPAPLAAADVAAIAAALERVEGPAPIAVGRFAPPRRMAVSERRLALVGRGAARPHGTS